ncbi:MAG TPA: hypothetical protein VIS76_13025 [Pseudomonadales bacterium]
MDWEAIGALGEIAGAAAVVLSLVYLAKQINISNRLARAEAFRIPNSDLGALNAAFGTDPAWRRAMQQAIIEQAQHADLAPDDALALDMYQISITNLYEQLFREVREGILDERMLSEFGAKPVIESEYYRSWVWPRYRAAFGPSFADYFEKRFELRSQKPSDG